MLEGRYDPALVLISLLVAVFASYTALGLAGRVHQGDARAARWWIAGGAFAMGTGIWSMHFVGMLAFRLPIALGYDFAITFVSWLIPIGASALALWQIGRERVRTRELVGSAIVIGLGINAMHYVGMAALRMEPGIQWDLPQVAASVVIAIGAAGAALWIALRLRSGGPRLWQRRLQAALLMGLAIAGMHYTGMAAANFPLGSVCLAASSTFTLTELALWVIVATVAVLAIALITSVFDARLEARTEVLRMSERLSAERQVLLERERAARAEAERASATKDQFLATLSHELRTPLNAILGWVQLLHLKRDEASVQRGLQTIERNARLQAQLIEDLLDMSRVVSGKVRLECHWVDPAQVMKAALETAQPAAVAKDIELDSDLEPGVPRIWGDPSRLQQVLWNLLSNAIKFTPTGGRVRLALRRRGDGVEVEVTDTGGGIPPDFLPHVFEPFRQAEASTARRYGGLGIGLAIVRQLVELHGGSIEAASDGDGRGARFTVRLPLTSHETPGRPSLLAPHAPAQAIAFEPVHLEGHCVMVVDDQADARDLLAQMLSDCGARVILAGGAEEALFALSYERPDVLVSDIGMPVVDGYELIRRLRAHPDERLARVPALALTAFTRAEDAAQALRAGFDGFLPKPVEGSIFVRQVAALVRGAAASAESGQTVSKV
ncbi:response regulator [Ramlibacter sp. AW1]|uniref:Virulence sensor protein BvgS n=1 Tax=Ramlibacter aurantiacus TaxID=2801330 RepID=A0A936ZKZ4_9BURK|nr:MHYT domain-containing protein [Ramlibacter aurantiacus]MBL0419155.1 response regulator [Ramlibacter aurantiacus]